ncbi:MAG: beta-lactamase family protein [Acidobacteria bacterium]|jgi:CubicO group peptidase (beta-lactamase class C family)|nr:beta-lactamase family protein [Bryobacteraceae bacterium CoA2 C42]
MRWTIVLFLAALLRAQEWSADKARRVEQAIEAERQRQQVVGVSVAIAEKGILRLAAGFGKADLEHDVPARPDTVYRLASLSKPITAVAALQLHERGKLNLSAPVQNYVPAFPQKQWGVSVLDLLGHLAGVRHYRGRELDSAVHYSNLLDPLAIFAQDPLVHQPRTKYLYTTYGYNLIGAAVEAAAGAPFLQYLRENIFKPAGMGSIRADDQTEIIRHRSRGYAKSKDGRIVNTGLADTSNKIPGGGLAATVFDLIAFTNAYETGLLLKRPTMRMMTQRQRLLDGQLTGYGLGWNLMPLAGRPAISHSGSQQGARTLLVLYPEANLTIVVLANSDHAVVNDFASAILKALETPSSA